ncbi:HlyD family type I secretion periplasmic adaptor subunit [Pseudotabrizicola formosa]|uniref:HlyD family type I secretion periplasmic adaptor subunit n=1 Tax=Pseudotabrizicola formosa TaxID=2030009 RepID=UPI000CD145EC|nr:HlyD family type I secretion periplasmic adaptor subunit [Pseudotabrizicola formosa]
MTAQHVPPGLGASGPLWLGSLTLLALIGGVGLWSVTTTIAGAIVAPGQVEVERNRQIVQHPDGGVVAEIMVTEGETVVAGEVLLRLEGGPIKSDLAIIEGQLSELQARRARLEAEREGAAQMSVPQALLQRAKGNPDTADQIQGQQRLFAARQETLAGTTLQLTERIAQISSYIAGIEAQAEALSDQRDLIRQELADQQALLAKGLAQAPRVLALQREAARLAGQAGELAASRAQAQGQITEIKMEILGLSSQRREDASLQLRDIGTTELELIQRQRALSDQVAQLNIRAPVAGIVLGLQITTPRAVLRPAEAVAHIIPQDRPLVIAARIAPIHIDEVYSGQPVKLMFPAYSARTTPEVTGFVTTVSADVLTDPTTQSLYYRAEIAIPPAEATRLGQTLVPGMPVDAFLQTGARTPLAYLLKPFSDYFAQAFRES